LQAHVDASKIEVNALKEDNTRWRGRAQQILAKYERIDPAEHELLKNQVLTLGEAQTRLEAASLTSQREIEVLKEGKLKGQKIITALRTALVEKEATIGQLNDKSASANASLLSEKDTEIEAWKLKNKDLIQRSNANTQKHTGERKRLREELLSYKESIVCVLFNWQKADQEAIAALERERDELRQRCEDGISTLMVKEELNLIAIDKIKGEKAALEGRISMLSKRRVGDCEMGVASPVAASSFSPVVDTLTPTEEVMVIEVNGISPNAEITPIVASPAPVVFAVQSTAPVALSSDLNPTAPSFIIAKSPVLIIAEEASIESMSIFLITRRSETCEGGK
jgi:hypothetical protein